MTTKTDAEHWQQHQTLKQDNPHAATLYLRKYESGELQLTQNQRGNFETILRESSE